MLSGALGGSSSSSGGNSGLGPLCGTGSRGIGVSLDEPPQATLKIPKVTISGNARVAKLNFMGREVARIPQPEKAVKFLSWRRGGGHSKVKTMIQRKTIALFALPLFSAAVVLGTGCSSEEPSGDGDGDGPVPYTFCAPADTCPPSVAGVDFTTPVSFKTDIYDAFLVSSCGGGTACHGTANLTGLGLGNSTNPMDTAAVVADLTTRTSAISGTKNVVAGDWQNSFLMQKLDGCQNDSGLTCDPEADSLIMSVCGGPCGDAMPQSEGDMHNPNEYPLTKAQRDKVRAWIQQGALNN